MFCIVLNVFWDPKACTPVSCVSIWDENLRVQKGELTLWDTHIDWAVQLKHNMQQHHVDLHRHGTTRQLVGL